MKSFCTAAVVGLNELIMRGSMRPGAGFQYLWHEALLAETRLCDQ